jgi:hypothetical protein
VILASLIVGDTLDFTDQVPLYPATDGWTLKYRLIPEFTTPVQIPITLTATTYLTTDYRVQADADDDGRVGGRQIHLGPLGRKVGRAADARQRQRAHIAAGQAHRIAAGPDRNRGGYDSRSIAVRALEAAQAALANFSATGGRVKRYAINGRDMEFDAASDILVLVNYWENEVRRENAARAQQAGKPDPRRIYTRLTNA